MTDTGPFDKDHPQVDPQRTKPLNAFDRSDGSSGQEYSSERELAEYGDSPAAPVHKSGLPAGGSGNAPGADLPPDNGSRAWIDQKTGEVHGSGAGAGGGSPGEDFDNDRKAGSGYPLTGTGQDGKGEEPA